MTAYALIYRKGGPKNFKWCRVLTEYVDSTCACNVAEELHRAGYLTRVLSARLLDSIGMPETYEHSERGMA